MKTKVKTMSPIKIDKLPGVKSIQDKRILALFSDAIDEGRSALQKGIKERKKREERNQRDWSAFRF